MSEFVFDSYKFNAITGEASFHYRYGSSHVFEEKVIFHVSDHVYDETILHRALFLSFVLIGTSYFKVFPTRQVSFSEALNAHIDTWQANFFNAVYQEGMSQYASENDLTRNELAHFHASSPASPIEKIEYRGEGILSLQSGGKDSLLAAMLLDKADRNFTPWYVSSSMHHPEVLDSFSLPLMIAMRIIDRKGLKKAIVLGGKNGHVPVTYIVQSLAVIQAILSNKSKILVSIGHEGEEPHNWIGDLPVNHQWSKTWSAEQAFARYVNQYVASGILIGSPLRSFSELRIAELFIREAWQKYGHTFSSCNHANYIQGSDNTQLTWCGACPKCANSFLLFAPFLSADELRTIFKGQDLFAKPELQEIFKGLLGIGGVMKPFECVGEIAELRFAYHKAQQQGGYEKVSFIVPESAFDYEREYDAQPWTRQMI